MLHGVTMELLMQVVPFFLVARVPVEQPWAHGPVYTFRVEVNSTAIPRDAVHSFRLNIATTLVCQPKGVTVLSCYFKNSMTDSFFTSSLDPNVPGSPVNARTPQKAYEIYEDQFEINFATQGLDSYLVNEDIQPRELDMIRAIIDQLNIGNVATDYDYNYHIMENFTQGICDTHLIVKNDKSYQRPWTLPDYLLRNLAHEFTYFTLAWIWKIRDMGACTHKVPYFFGYAGSHEDLAISPTSSESRIVITSTEFLSGTRNVIKLNKGRESVILDENITLWLESITPAKQDPPEVRDPEEVSMFIGDWMMDDSDEVESSIEDSQADYIWIGT
ncbi:uncharacterized protein LOC143352643 [Halictus rubicundus]|uniref:uncharacterized protein LOC143352643 n=1 Tax=Halictus rubicundus TaxID=77578 RepID=UPI004035EDB3